MLKKKWNKVLKKAVRDGCFFYVKGNIWNNEKVSQYEHSMEIDRKDQKMLYFYLS